MTSGPPLDVVLYTDGACDPNPGPGGWGAVLLLPGQPPLELSGGEAETTNNRMEIRAAVEALRALPGPARALLHTDSQYLCWGFQQLAGPRGKRALAGAKNADLWAELADALAGHSVTCRWVQGHAGDEGNERAHTLAAAAVPSPRLPLDDEDAIHLFTAVSCASASPGPGGWATLLRYRHAAKLLGCHEPQASANRLHLLAALRGIEAVKRPLPLHVYTTSEYLRDGMTRWVQGWQARDWHTHQGTPVSHRDLWEALLRVSAPYTVLYHLVRDPAGLPEMREARRHAADNAQAVPAPV
jgi:ribonuclease HI